MNHKSKISIKEPFTLVELLIVIAIIVLLCSLLLPSLRTAMETAKRISCSNKEKQIYLCWQNYASDFNGYLCPVDTAVMGATMWTPAHRPWTNIMRNYLPNVSLPSSNAIHRGTILECPSKPFVSEWHDAWYTGYGMNQYGIGGKKAVSEKPYKTIGMIRLPTQVVAFGDSLADSWVDQRLGYSWVDRVSHNEFRHLKKSNYIFGDGHVEPKDYSFINPPWGWWDKAPWGAP
ncbi:MAG: hypothetical protein A2X49_04270 [Lentisphaerae bacterium GWF2_52_8]|nr:MAG: hypothetical protein A2X49_04270 [Lentisphaerae bacterium GWF2_52_8]